MSLRFRLNLLVTLLSLAILGLGSLLVVHNARRAVFEEIQSTANLTERLLEIAFGAGSGDAPRDLRERLLEQVEAFDGVRHLRIALADGERETPIGGAGQRADGDRAPAWFARLVAPPELEFRHTVVDSAASGHAELVIRTDPTDEIDESWVDARSILGLVLAFVVAANAAFFFAVGRWLAPLGRILQAFEGIERGNYSARLPAFDLPELDGLAGKFNHMAEVLERSREENRELAQRSLAIQERERRFLAQELHDEFGQSISAIRAVAASMRRADDKAAIAGAAGTIAEIGSRMYAVVTGMIRRLRPVRLDEFGLVAAVEELVDGWNERHQDAFCSLSTEGDLEQLDEAIDIGLYRIVQESLTNAEKHADAKAVRVHLARGRDAFAETLRLEISDDGVGFDPTSTRRGLGLLGIRERAEAMNGTFELEAEPERGVVIRIDVPLPNANAAAGR